LNQEYGALDPTSQADRLLQQRSGELIGQVAGNHFVLMNTEQSLPVGSFGVILNQLQLTRDQLLGEQGAEHGHQVAVAFNRHDTRAA
jgi:hypothetical protein